MTNDDGQQPRDEQSNQEWIAEYEQNDKPLYYKKKDVGRYTKETGGGGTFTPAPAGTHVARCIKLTDLGTQTSEYQGQVNIRNQVLVSWELPNKTLEVDGIEKPFIVSKFYTNSLNEKATLRHDLESWRSKSFTNEELAKFDLMNILKKPCMLSIIPKDGGGTKVATVSAMPDGIQCPPQFNQEETFWLDEFSQEVFDNLSEGIQNIIKKSPEYRGLGNDGSVFSKTDSAIEDMEDSIPF